MAGLTGRRGIVALGVIVMLGGFGYLLYGGIGENLVYFLTPKELLARGTKAYDASVRLGGQVKPGSVKWTAETMDLRFVVTDGERDIPVRSKGAPPQMFRDGMGVVVEGRYAKDDVFDAKSLMVKHSNEYRAPAPGKKPGEMYRSLMKDGAK